MADRSAERHAQQKGQTTEEIWAWRDRSTRAASALQPEEIAEVIAFL